MWFTNLLIYRFTQAIPFTLEQLIEALAQKPARECASQETHALGWTTPFGRHSVNLVQVAAGFWLIAMQKEERILPGQVVKDELSAKVGEIEQRDARKVYKKERDTLKDEIVMQLLPRAFTRRQTTFALICPADGWIAVNAGSWKRAEDLLSLLRECTGTLPVRPVNVKLPTAVSMTQWVKDSDAPAGLQIGDNCELTDTSADGGQVRCKHQDLASDEIQLHLSAGKQVTQLDLLWDNKLSFTLNERMIFKRLHFDDLLIDEASNQAGDDMASQLDASLTIMGGTLQQFIPALFEALGGEDQPQGI
ncbi:recombination-associated protein RdgC [Pseudomonas aestusnigri]|uniref:recombination-associated protein RdgC n=1 Tax=Halopseudomonas aestusnigri TaxID=857252 RepID=UPI001D1850F3|nr:recombination-associated protein RdgC [Halopseudomonas aestusnigri]MCC4260815.1 recombination-associated protein RdgC [Halopseudomonas aestusnigri]